MAVSELAGTRLQRFSYLGEELADTVFARHPVAMREATTAEALGAALGALLYSPATNRKSADRLLDGSWPSVTAMVFCLEDAIADRDLATGESHVVRLLRMLRDRTQEHGTRDRTPFVFVRVRDATHLERLLESWGELVAEVDGIVAPKIGAQHLRRYVDVAISARPDADRPLWVLPILEGADIGRREDRPAALAAISDVLEAHHDRIPCVRIGGTDLSSLWGLRRPRDFTIYDVAVVRDIIADVVNVLGREPRPVAISGVVWEYIRDARVFKPRLRETPFTEEFGAEHGLQMRSGFVSAALDGLIRETLLDRANGLHGKTIIHPSHAAFVDAATVVTNEEWESAQAVLATASAGDGVSSMRGGERMNEPKPHAAWARRTVLRAQAFGVLRPEHSLLALLRDPVRA